MYVVAQLKDRIAGLLTGVDITKVPDVNGAIERAARVMAQKISIPEATNRAVVTLYDSVFDYTAPSTIFGGSVVDIRPQGVSRTPLDYVYRQPIALFDRTKCFLPNGVAVTFEYDNGVPRMRVVSVRTTPSIMLDPMTATTGWVAGGTASGLVLDQTVYYQSPGSLRFNLTGAGSGYIEKTLQSSVNMTAYNGVGVVFLAIDTQDIIDLTSFSIRLGSSSVNYVTVSATQGFIGAFQVNDWTLVAFNLAGASTTGSPNFAAIQYVRAIATTTASIVNMRFGNLFAALPSPYEILYKSAAVFSANGVPSSQITSDNDTIILNDQAYTILEHEGAIATYMNGGGTAANAQVASLEGALNGARAKNGAVLNLGLYDLYRADNPSEVLETIGNWYTD